MKSSLKAFLIALLVVVGVVNVQSAQTNIVQTLTFQLTAWTQGANTTNGTTTSVVASSRSIVTKDVIGWLGMATTNDFTGGQLLVLNTLGDPGSKLRIVVRVKTTVPAKDVDVSDFFAVVAHAATVNNYSFNNTNNLVGPGTYHGYWGFYLQNDDKHPALPVTFQATGYGTDVATGIKGSKGVVLGLSDQFTMANAAGTGMANGQPFVFFGSIIVGGKISAKTLEVTP